MSKQKPPREAPRAAPTDTSDSGDFAAMLEAFEQAPTPSRLTPGMPVSGKIFHISKESVFVSLSQSQEGSMSRAECTNDDGELTVTVGDPIDAFVVSMEDGITLGRKLGRGSDGSAMLEEAREHGIPVDGTVTAVNKGGLEVTVVGGRAFCPMGQIAAGFVEDPQTLVGQTLTFLVREAGGRGRDVVLSRRALQERERASAQKKLLETLAVGQRLQGRVTRTAAFGAFVDIGGIEGLIPISEMAHAHVTDVSEICQANDMVEVEVRSIEPDPKRSGQLRIGLSRKSTQQDPWQAQAETLHEGAQLAGTVLRIEPFGAFVEVYPGITGLIHISEMSTMRVQHPKDLLSLKQSVTVRVLRFDSAARRLSLSLKDAAPAGASGDAARVVAGSAVEGVVERIESYGIFLKLADGQVALLPAAESGTPPGHRPQTSFSLGQQRHRRDAHPRPARPLRVSKVAHERREEQDQVAQYHQKQETRALAPSATCSTRNVRDKPRDAHGPSWRPVRCRGHAACRRVVRRRGPHVARRRRADGMRRRRVVARRRARTNGPARPVGRLRHIAPRRCPDHAPVAARSAPQAG